MIQIKNFILFIGIKTYNRKMNLPPKLDKKLLRINLICKYQHISKPIPKFKQEFSNILRQRILQFLLHIPLPHCQEIKIVRTFQRLLYPIALRCR